MFRKNMKILVALGFTERPKSVLEKAINIARQFEAEVYVMHVITEMPKLNFYYDAYKLWEDFRDSAVKETLELMNSYVAKVAGDYENIEMIIDVGEPSVKINARAEELDVDLIIMGHHVRKGISHVIHQNNCEKVVRFAKKPVLSFYVEEIEAPEEPDPLK